MIVIENWTQKWEGTAGGAKGGEACLNWACLSSWLIPVRKDVGIFTPLFHKSKYSWPCSWHVPLQTSAFQSSLSGAFLPVPFLMLAQCTVYKVTGGLSFSVISWSVFKLFSRVAWELCHLQCALSFYCEILAIRSDDSLAWPWYPSPRLIPSCTQWSLCSPPGAIFLPAAEWRSWWTREACGRHDGGMTMNLSLVCEPPL